MFVEKHNPNHKGNVAELAIAKEAAALGLSVVVATSIAVSWSQSR
jgi:hypothetical protein